MTRPTEAEFAELARKRDEAVDAIVKEVCERMGQDPAGASYHVSHSGECYCACPDGPCQHVWDGAIFQDEDGLFASVTCSRCGALSMYHDMRVGP